MEDLTARRCAHTTREPVTRRIWRPRRLEATPTSAVSSAADRRTPSRLGVDGYTQDGQMWGVDRHDGAPEPHDRGPAQLLKASTQLRFAPQRRGGHDFA